MKLMKSFAQQNTENKTDPENVVYYDYRGERIPVNKTTIEEIQATAAEAELSPDEFINEIVEMTYEKLISERSKAQKKRNELIAKLHALKAKGLQEASEFVDAQYKPMSPSSRTEDNTNDGIARNRGEVSVSSTDTQKEERIKVSRNSQEINYETRKDNRKSPLNFESNNRNNDTDKFETTKTETGDSIWGPMILNNMLLNNFDNVCNNVTMLTKEEEFGNWKRQLKLVLRGQGLEDLVSVKAPGPEGLIAQSGDETERSPRTIGNASQDRETFERLSDTC